MSLGTSGNDAMTFRDQGLPTGNIDNIRFGTSGPNQQPFSVQLGQFNMNGNPQQRQGQGTPPTNQVFNGAQQGMQSFQGGMPGMPTGQPFFGGFNPNAMNSPMGGGGAPGGFNSMFGFGGPGFGGGMFGGQDMGSFNSGPFGGFAPEPQRPSFLQRRK